MTAKALQRLPDWDSRLAAYLASKAAEPHAFGRHDCLLFVAGTIKAVTGKDFARGHRGKYDTAAAAKRYLKSIGFASPRAMIAAFLPEKPVAMAGRGDIVLDREGIPGVCIGGDALMLGQTDGDDGYVRVPRSQWARAWRV